MRRLERYGDANMTANFQRTYATTLVKAAARALETRWKVMIRNAGPRLCQTLFLNSPGYKDPLSVKRQSAS